jgi:uncharacterized membrane protein YqgA involved in biofilm formation
VIGAFLNALGILLGALGGLLWPAPLSARAQNFCKSALGALIAFYGLRLIFENLSGGFGGSVKQLGLALLAVVLGQLVGKILALQKISNHCGRYASGLLAAAQKSPPGRPTAGLAAATILFCAAPLGIIGAVVDGLSGYFYLLALKAVVDGLAMMSFVKLFRWPVALAALPVFLFLNGLSLGVHRFALPWLTTPAMLNSVHLAAGLTACVTVLVILEVRRVELANYLPALVVAPLLARWLG